MRTAFRMTGALLVALATGACASGGSQGVRVAAQQVPAARPPSPAHSRFMTDMIGHHAQALVMARMAPHNDASSSVRTLAGRIINAQQDEIRAMQVWLKDHGQPVPTVDSTGVVQASAGHDPGQHLMAGMLTPEQLAELEKARGTEFDTKFLRYMIQHHRGAVSMVEQLFADPGPNPDDTVFKLASDINADQLTEIERMRRMLASITIGIQAP